jgi:hypothetical protein
MWPFWKKKKYTATDLSTGGCERAAERIRKARGSGQIVHIGPPHPDLFLGPVHPPGGGVITNWYNHRAVLENGRFYDKMTGPEGMSLDEYSQLFENWDMLIVRPVEEPQ